MKEIKKIGILSLGKIAAALYFIFGIITVLVILLLRKLASTISIPGMENLEAFSQLTAAQILLIPIWQVVIGFIAGIVIAFLYNLLAKKIGGIKIEI